MRIQILVVSFLPQTAYKCTAFFKDRKMYAVTKAKRDTGAQSVVAGKFRQPRRLSGPIYVDDGFFLSRWMTDFFYLSTWMTEYSVTLMLCYCVTLAFLTVKKDNTEHRNIKRINAISES
jgi:hypothetical protein